MLGDVDQVDDDSDRDVAGGGLRVDLPDLVLVPVGQRDPGGLAAGVAAVGLGEHGGDDLGGVSGHARGQPLVPGRRPRGPRAGSQDVLRGARDGGDDVDRAGLGHSLRVRTSLWDSRPSCCGTDLRARRSARGRSCPGRIRMPLASHDSTSTSPGRRRLRAAGIETREVSGGRPGQLLGLPGAQLAPGLASDLRARLPKEPRAVSRAPSAPARASASRPAGPAAHRPGARQAPRAPGRRSGTPPPARRCWPAPGHAPPPPSVRQIPSGPVTCASRASAAARASR